MKFLAVIILSVCTMAGAALLTPKQATAPKSKPMAKAIVIVPPPDDMVVSVKFPDYEGYTNVEVVIVAKTGLLEKSWKERFHGRTNEFRFHRTNDMEFFRAYSRFIGTTNN